MIQYLILHARLTLQVACTAERQYTRLLLSVNTGSSASLFQKCEDPHTFCRMELLAELRPSLPAPPPGDCGMTMRGPPLSPAAPPSPDNDHWLGVMMEGGFLGAMPGEDAEEASGGDAANVAAVGMPLAEIDGCLAPSMLPGRGLAAGSGLLVPHEARRGLGLRLDSGGVGGLAAGDGRVDCGRAALGWAAGPGPAPPPFPAAGDAAAAPLPLPPPAMRRTKCEGVAGVGGDSGVASQGFPGLAPAAPGALGVIAPLRTGDAPPVAPLPAPELGESSSASISGVRDVTPLGSVVVSVCVSVRLPVAVVVLITVVLVMIVRP